jgi:hypothetical protein
MRAEYIKQALKKDGTKGDKAFDEAFRGAPPGDTAASDPEEGGTSLRSSLVQGC